MNTETIIVKVKDPTKKHVISIVNNDNYDVKDYLGFVRYLILKNQVNAVPVSLSNTQLKSQIEFVDLQHLAQRVGLISFDCFDAKNVKVQDPEIVKNLIADQIVLSNTTDVTRYVHSSELECKALDYTFKPIKKNGHLLKLPPKAVLKIKICFELHDGSENAAYSEIAGFETNQIKKDQVVTGHELSFEIQEEKFPEILKNCLEEIQDLRSRN